MRRARWDFFFGNLKCSHGDITSESACHCNTEALEIFAQDMLSAATKEARFALKFDKEVAVSSVKSKKESKKNEAYKYGVVGDTTIANRKAFYPSSELRNNANDLMAWDEL